MKYEVELIVVFCYNDKSLQDLIRTWNARVDIFASNVVNYTQIKAYNLLDGAIWTPIRIQENSHQSSKINN